MEIYRQKIVGDACFAPWGKRNRDVTREPIRAARVTFPFWSHNMPRVELGYAWHDSGIFLDHLSGTSRDVPTQPLLSCNALSSLSDTYDVAVLRQTMVKFTHRKRIRRLRFAVRCRRAVSDTLLL